MLEQGQFWRNKLLRDHVAVVEDKIAPSIVFVNSVYLNVHTRQWLNANIWIYKDRIVYVGQRMPKKTEQTEIIDCTGQYLVPGYIEPHAHPSQLYNPEEFAYYAATYGTTTLINDNLRLLYLLDKKKAFTLIDEFHKLPMSMFWWGRYDSQSKLMDDEEKFNTDDILSWVNHPSVIQGGELSAWPQLLNGDDRLLYWIQETKRLRKRVEGHFPGASEDTLTKLKLLGASADHEAITGEEVIRRLQLGYHVSLRYSAIRPDLPNLLEDLFSKKIDAFDQMTFTTDGSPPANEQGIINTCIDIAIKAGVPPIEAYRMATYNAAKYYGLDEIIGSIAPGRLAHINVLYEKNDPNPLSVLGKGEWIVKDGTVKMQRNQIDWQKHGIKKIDIKWDLEKYDLQFSIPIGIKMKNDVILEPYAVETDITAGNLPSGNKDAFLVLLDRFGKWRVNTVINGFTEHLGGLCSTFSTTGDIILIGKSKEDMETAFRRMKEIGGGIVIVHKGEILYELSLSLEGAMYVGKMEKLNEEKEEFKKIIIESGFEFHDPIYCLLFLSATHLPYIRVTPQGMIDVKNQEVVVPANMR